MIYSSTLYSTLPKAHIHYKAFSRCQGSEGFNLLKGRGLGAYLTWSSRRSNPLALEFLLGTKWLLQFLENIWSVLPSQGAPSNLTPRCYNLKGADIISTKGAQWFIPYLGAKTLNQPSHSRRHSVNSSSMIFLSRRISLLSWALGAQLSVSILFRCQIHFNAPNTKSFQTLGAHKESSNLGR